MQRLLRLILAFALIACTTSGCVLRLLLGGVAVSSVSEFVDRLFAALDAQSTTAICNHTFNTLNCTYVVDGVQIASTAGLLSEFGIFGAFIDPVVLELPDGVTGVAGTFDDGAGHSGSLVVQAGLTTIPVDDTRTLTAATGKQLVIADFPPGVPIDGVDYDLAFSFQQDVPKGTGGAIEVKILYVQKVEIAGHTFYPPFLPCTSDLTQVPAITIPIAATPVPLVLPTGISGCAGENYQFFNIVPQLTATPTPTPLVTPTGVTATPTPSVTPTVAAPTFTPIPTPTSTATTAAIDDFHCFSVKPTKGAVVFAGAAGVQIVDPAFGESARYDVRKARDLCAPADEDGVALKDAATHLERYTIKALKGEPKHAKRTGLAFVNRLGTITLDTVNPQLLLVPTAKDPAAPPRVPDPSSHEVDHFACYAAKTTKGTPGVAKGVEITVGDQLTDPPRRYVVKKPVRLCDPVQKNGEPVTHADRLICYQVKATSGRCAAGATLNAGGGCKRETDCGGVKKQTSLCVKQPKLAAVAGLHTANQFGSETLDAGKDAEVCLVSRLPTI